MMPIFNAVMIAGAPANASVNDVVDALIALNAQVDKYPASASRYEKHITALTQYLEGDRSVQIIADDGDIPASAWNILQPILAGVDDMQQELAAGSFPLSLAFHIADWASDFVPETLIDAICSIQQIKPENKEQARKREFSLRQLQKALADRQAERMAAGAYGA